MNRVELELIHRELDGENSPEESRRLENLLAEHDGLRKMYDDLAAVDSRLRQSEMTEPPAWLRRSVMESLPAPRRREGLSLAGFLRGVWDGMQARPALAYAYTFVAGLVIGLGTFAVVFEDAPADARDLYGALMRDDAIGAEALPIQQPRFEGRVDVLTSSDLFIVELSLEAEGDLVVSLVPDPPLTLRGITRKTVSAGDAGSFEVVENSVVLSVQGADAFDLVFARGGAADPAVRLEVRRDNQLIYEKWLRSAKS